MFVHIRGSAIISPGGSFQKRELIVRCVQRRIIRSLQRYDLTVHLFHKRYRLVTMQTKLQFLSNLTLYPHPGIKLPAKHLHKWQLRVQVSCW